MKATSSHGGLYCGFMPLVYHRLIADAPVDRPNLTVVVDDAAVHTLRTRRVTPDRRAALGDFHAKVMQVAGTAVHLFCVERLTELELFDIERKLLIPKHDLNLVVEVTHVGQGRHGVR